MEIVKNSLYIIIIILLFISLWFVYLNKKNIQTMNNNYKITIKKINKDTEILEDAMVKLDDINSHLAKVIAQKNTAFVTVTFYHPQSGGINSDSTPNKTALMTRPMPGRTVAISTSLVRRGWLGQDVYIEGHGVFYCEDRMAVGLNGDRIDICVGTLDEALKGGRITNVFANKI